MKKLICIAAVAAALSAPVAMAQQNPERSAYLNAAVGNSKYDGFNDSDDVTGGKLLLGYNFHRHFGVEGGYIDFGKGQFRDGVFQGDVRARGANVSLVARTPLSEPLSIYGKVGYFAGKIEANANGTSLRDRDNDPTYGAGIAWMFSPGLGLNLDWDRLGRSSDSTDMVSLGLVMKFR
jgi:OmpA-OmpF porin, OOP family